MARIDLNIPSLGGKFLDIRDAIPGDSFNWSWVRLLTQVNFLAIHHSAGPDTQTPDIIANFHINSNGWGGIGYHFLIAKDGTTYYVGDISTARANVANLNDQVIGICLIGNFTAGRIPTDAQFDSTRKLCDFFINNYPDLPNVDSWDDIKGHKELPGQSTACPGDNWPAWKSRITTATPAPTPTPSLPTPTPPPPQPTPPPTPPTDRGTQITELYRTILGRDPDMGGLQTYTNGPLSIDQIALSMINSKEHRDLITASKETTALKSQVDSLQTSLASLNQQVISLQETLQEREQEIAELKFQLNPQPSTTPAQPPRSNGQPQKDTSLTIIGALFNLYKFIFPPRKVD